MPAKNYDSKIFRIIAILKKLDARERVKSGTLAFVFVQ